MIHNAAFQFLAIACLTFSSAVAASPHPFHISTAEFEFNRKTGVCEVSLKLHSMDLEKALATEFGKRMNLEKDAAEEQITKYLNKHFVIFAEDSASREESEKTPAEHRSSVKFVGKEFKKSWLWLYFELKPPVQQASLKMQNTLLLETTSDQINTVSVRHEGKRTGLRFDRKRPRLDFSKAWLN